LEKEKVSSKQESSHASSPANIQSSPASSLQNGAGLPNPTSFLSKILASSDAMASPSFFEVVDLAMLVKASIQTRCKTCKLEREMDKDKKQKTIVAAAQAQVQIFKKTIDPKHCPTLFAGKALG
jgi:hypothetical protein